MTEEIRTEEADELAANRVTEQRDDGIEVDEMIDIESIELCSRPATVAEDMGWDMAPTHDGEALFVDEELDYVLDWQSAEEYGDATSQLAELENEHLHLAAVVADLRQAAAQRELELQEQIERSRALLRMREETLTDQEARIAALAVKCEELRGQLGAAEQDAGGEPPQAQDPEAAGVATGATSIVRNLEQQLTERDHALQAARQEARRLQLEQAELADALARRGAEVERLMAGALLSAVSRDGQDEFKTGLGSRLDMPVGGEPDEAGMSPPGSEEPTLAVDESPPCDAAPTGRDQAVAPDPTPDDAPARERRLRVAAAKVPARQRRRRTSKGIRRYLIALDRAREEVCELAQQRMYVGRGVEADLRIKDATASRLHAVLYLERGSTIVEDAGSTNGVFVNKGRVRRAVLVDGDTVTFGTVRFQYRVGPAVMSQA